jgi:Flp pilus assembly protein TadG
MRTMLLSSLLKGRHGGPIARFLKGRLGGTPARLLKDRRGGVAPMFALAVIPVVGLVGASVDYSRANNTKAGMQSALDATALAMAKLAPNLTQSQLQTQTAAYFNAMFNHPEAKNLTITPSYTTSGGSQLTVTGSATLDTAFMKIMGYSSLNVGSSSTVRWGMNRLRVALALDNTGSMAGSGKIDALKTATKSLLDQLKAAAASNGDVYVSIIPFNKDVNVGTSTYTNASWVDWEDWDDDNGEDNSTTTCTTKKTGKSGKAKKKCTTTTSWIPDNHNTWNGCITDRDKDYDVKATVPTTSTPATLFPAEQYSACPVPLTGLSYDWNKLNSLVNTMKADGTTNQTIGLVWAWMSLTGGGPFTVPAKDPNYKYQDIIILMSDGLNTENRWDGNGSWQSSAVDERMALACTNAKNAGLTVYTIHVNTDGDPTSQILRNCASDTTKFYTVTSSAQIGAVFTTIGSNLSQLRISK